MPYQALARKYRPRNFPEVVGQTHVVSALSNALSQNKLHHAYLFTGTHGIGKTTLARIFAKCLNCEQGISPTPCNQCTSCQEIDQGRFPDFFEIDAASRTKVEDTRELLDNVQYSPAKGRFKVYLIDEVHMLSGHSFNALLKTLEEPPEHVKFLLATTDPKKLPATVLSRCLQFHLGQMSAEQIAKHLENVLQQEKIEFEAPALMLIGKAANGSLRDSLSLLDQCIAFGNGTVRTRDASTMLGTIEPTTLFEILHALSDRDGENVLKCVEKLSKQGADFLHALNDLLSLLHHISVVQVVANAPIENNPQQVKALAEKLGAEDTQLFYQIGIVGRRDFNFAPSPKVGFEMTLLRMLAFYPDNSEPKPATKRAKMPTTKVETSAPAAAAGQSQWHDILPKLTLSGAALALAKNCSLDQLTETQVVLKATTKQKALMQPKQIQRINDALSEYLGRKVTLKIDMTENLPQTPTTFAKEKQAKAYDTAKQTITTDPKVQQMMQTFNATLVEGSIITNETDL